MVISDAAAITLSCQLVRYHSNPCFSLRIQILHADVSLKQTSHGGFQQTRNANEFHVVLKIESSDTGVFLEDL